MNCLWLETDMVIRNNKFCVQLYNIKSLMNQFLLAFSLALTRICGQNKLAINKKWIEEIADYNWGKIVWFTGN